MYEKQQQHPNRKQGMNETGPIPSIAIFDAWNKIPTGFEMAYIPAKDDYLQWSLTNQYRPSKYDVPYINGINGPLYGRDLLSNHQFGVMNCSPYVVPVSQHYGPNSSPC